MNKPSTANAKHFLSHNPTMLGRVNGVDLYEHPIHGDEWPLVAITADGRVKVTAHWEVPAADEADDLGSL